MGKCRIISHDGDGLYTVQELPDFTLIEAEIARLTAELSDIDNVELINLEIAYLLAKSDTDTKKAAADALIAAYASDPTPAKLEAVNASIGVVGEAVIAESTAKIPYDAVKARKLAIEKRIVKLYSAIGTPSPVQIWCTDLSDGLKFRGLYDADDEAGTIELIGDDSETTLQPHYADLGLYSTSRDGLMTPTAALTPASYYYNRAMKPGWQKWRHQFRPGIITGVTGGGGFDVTLDDIRSREQSDFIPVSDFEDGLLTGVTAQYMNCNESAFSVDDHVIVNTQWAGALREDIIIGFVDNPKPCDINGFNYHPYVAGGTEPGWHDWQNVQPGPPASWSMKTPVLTDVITDGTGNAMNDWKGFLNDGTKILVQWRWNGDFIYVDGVKVATTPNFNLSGAAGDPITIAVMSGIAAAWVTKDKQYIYAIPVENGKSRRVLRKTIEIELTGAAYHATTDPDGWEDSSAFGPTSYTDFVVFGQPNVNESGTESRSMDAWVHGAKRTPQLSAGSGAVWLPLPEYNDSWNEESQINIATPSASSISGAGISHQFNGFIGSHIYVDQTWSDKITYSGHTTDGQPYTSGVRHRIETEAWSGNSAGAVGYNGDTVGYLWTNGVGSSTDDHTWTNSGGGLSQNESDITTGMGLEYTCDFEIWTFPKYILDHTTTTTSFETGGSDYCDSVDYTQVLNSTWLYGNLQAFNVSDSIYVFAQNEDYLEWVTTYGGTPSIPAGCPGTRDITTLNTERGLIELGDNEQIFEKVVVDTFTSDPIALNSGAALWPPSLIWNTGDPDPYTYDYLLPGSAKYNYTGYDVPRSANESYVVIGGAKDHDGNYIYSAWHGYSIPAGTFEYWNYLTNGNLETLDELDNGTGTVYYYPHVAN